MNVDEKAYNDPRFRRLASILGWHVDTAVGACVRVWMAALNRVHPGNPVGVVTRDEADFATDHGAALVDAMVTVGLARVETPGEVYFAGIEERGNFILEQRRRGAKGGKNKARSQRLANATGAAKPTLPARLQPESDSGSSLTSGSFSGSGSFSLPSGDASRLWEMQERLRAESVPGSRSLKPTKERLARVEARLKDNSPEDCEHVLRIYAEEAKAKPESAGWFNGETNWRKDNFDRALGRVAPSNGHSAFVAGFLRGES